MSIRNAKKFTQVFRARSLRVSQHTKCSRSVIEVFCLLKSFPIRPIWKIVWLSKESMRSASGQHQRTNKRNENKTKSYKIFQWDQLTAILVIFSLLFPVAVCAFFIFGGRLYFGIVVVASSVFRCKRTKEWKVKIAMDQKWPLSSATQIECHICFSRNNCLSHTNTQSTYCRWRGDGVGDRGIRIMAWRKTETQCFDAFVIHTKRIFCLHSNSTLGCLLFSSSVRCCKVQEVCCFVRNTFYTYFCHLS